LLKKLKFIIKFIDYLINHWSFNSLSDSISGSNLSIESSSDLIFTQDQNELANNALYLKNNYLQTSVVSCYFYNEFTITIWFKTLFTKKLSLIDFNSDNKYNIGIRIENNKIIFWAKDNQIVYELKSRSLLKKYNNWYHLAVVYSKGHVVLYLNGNYDSSSSEQFYELDQLLNKKTNLNYIGKSFTFNILSSTIIIDEIKIYNKSLDKNQLKIDSQINLNSSNVIFTTDEILIIILIFILFLIFIAVIRYFIYKKKNQDRRRRRRIINARFSSSNCDKIFFVSQL
jgi:hypothetical protein